MDGAAADRRITASEDNVEKWSGDARVEGEDSGMTGRWGPW